MSVPPPDDSAKKKDLEDDLPSLADHDDDADRTKTIQWDSVTLNQDFEMAKKAPPCLLMIRGPFKKHRFLLNQPEMTVGRDPNADVSIPDPSVSRSHAKIITMPDGGIEVLDLGSSNGTLLNGTKLGPNETKPLAKEDMVRFGNTILKFLPAGELETLALGVLEDQANMDPMTQIFNKGYLMDALEVEFKRAKTLHNNLSMIFFDIDHFKQCNDTYGHDAGDYVLKELSTLVRNRFVRPKDIFGRYGGEEFMMLLLNTNSADAAKVAENIRASLEAHRFVYEGTRIPVTSSFGVAELTASIETSQTLIKVADKALYQSKENGRNQVTVSA